MAKKSKAIILELHCPCGKTWVGAYPTGKLKKTAKCPACFNHILTSNNHRTQPDKNCISCKRPLINKHHCTYCGHPVKNGIEIAKEPAVQFCSDDNMPGRKGKKSWV